MNVMSVRVVILLFFACCNLFAFPAMPLEFKPTFSNNVGNTWREMGQMPNPVAMANIIVKTALTGQGYKLVHDISEEGLPNQHLQFWQRSDEDIILMLWKIDISTTGLAWGISARDNSAQDNNFPRLPFNKDLNKSSILERKRR